MDETPVNGVSVDVPPLVRVLLLVVSLEPASAAASLDVASLDVASLGVGSLDVASLDVASLDPGSVEAVTLDVGSLDVKSLDVSLDAGSLNVASLDAASESDVMAEVILSILGGSVAVSRLDSESVPLDESEALSGSEVVPGNGSSSVVDPGRALDVWVAESEIEDSTIVSDSELEVSVDETKTDVEAAELMSKLVVVAASNELVVFGLLALSEEEGMSEAMKDSVASVLAVIPDVDVSIVAVASSTEIVEASGEPVDASKLLGASESDEASTSMLIEDSVVMEDSGTIVDSVGAGGSEFVRASDADEVSDVDSVRDEFSSELVGISGVEDAKVESSSLVVEDSAVAEDSEREDTCAVEGSVVESDSELADNSVPDPAESVEVREETTTLLSSELVRMTDVLEGSVPVVEAKSLDVVITVSDSEMWSVASADSDEEDAEAISDKVADSATVSVLDSGSAKVSELDSELVSEEVAGLVVEVVSSEDVSEAKAVADVEDATDAAGESDLGSSPTVDVACSVERSLWDVETLGVSVWLVSLCAGESSKEVDSLPTVKLLSKVCVLINVVSADTVMVSSVPA